ncbi:mitochondrial carrier [Xylaria palmicola]|nr:mitochondrial carrier [Xylaria palmicola]
MSADWWAGLISGAVGIIVGNSLDVKKVQLQAQTSGRPLSATNPPSLTPGIISSSHSQPQSLPYSVLVARTSSTSPLLVSSFITRCLPLKSSLLAGTAAPILGSGALNALLFMAYNRTEDALNRYFPPPASSHFPNSTPYLDGSTTGTNLWTTWLAGAAGGLAIWVVSTPTELIKCRAQLASAAGARSHGPTSSPPSLPSAAPPSSSHRIFLAVLRGEGIRGLYRGGVVTALRDSIGYGFYFWAYELSARAVTALLAAPQPAERASSSGWAAAASSTQEAVKVLLCGGIAGVVTWASVFPLDVVKTRVQAQVYSPASTSPLGAAASDAHKRKGAVQIAREAYREGGARVFFRGLGVCSLRAFVVNAVQWGIYKWIMRQLA